MREEGRTKSVASIVDGMVCKTFINEMLYVKLIIEMIGGCAKASSTASDSSSSSCLLVVVGPLTIYLPQQVEGAEQARS